MPIPFVFVVNFTYDGKTTRLMEMEDFFRADLTPLDDLRSQQGEIPLREAYSRTLLRDWHPNAVYLEDTSCWKVENRRLSVKFHDFVNPSKDFSCNYSPSGMLQDFMFTRAMLGEVFFHQRPLLISFRDSTIPPLYRSALDKLRSIQLRPLEILNAPRGGILLEACQDPVVFHQLARAASEFFPNTLLIDLLNPISKENRESPEQFLEAYPSETYILRSTNLYKSRVTQYLKKEEVLPFLDILRGIQRQPNWITDPGNKELLKKFNLWGQNFYEKRFPFPFVFLQTFTPSKTMEHQEQLARPTGRAIIKVLLDDLAEGISPLECLGSYWQFPSEENQTQPPTAPIDPKDWSTIFEHIQSNLSPLLLQMHRTPFDNLWQHFMNSETNMRYAKTAEFSRDSVSMHAKRIQEEVLPKLVTVDLDFFFRKFKRDEIDKRSSLNYLLYFSEFQRLLTIPSLGMEAEVEEEKHNELFVPQPAAPTGTFGEDYLRMILRRRARGRFFSDEEGEKPMEAGAAANDHEEMKCEVEEVESKAQALPEASPPTTTTENTGYCLMM